MKHSQKFYVVPIVLIFIFGLVIYKTKIDKVETPLNTIATSTPTLTSTSPTKPTEVEKPKVSLGDFICKFDTEQKLVSVQIPITIVGMNWSYGETRIESEDKTSSSGKTFENVGMVYPFPEIIPADWGTTTVSVKLWQNKKQQDKPVYIFSKTILPEESCKHLYP